MIKPNWDIFKVKFSENPQDHFEWFCYLLFCREFRREKGIFRYKNQSAIETDPISCDGEIIGWQAKFYDTSLSKNKDELMGALEKAKRDYPSITKLLIYTNKEWGQNKGKAPQGLLDIEKRAKELGIKPVWNAASFFESEFVAFENEIIAKHFFTQSDSCFKQVEKFIKHAVNVLSEIQTYASFNGKIVEINRSNILKELDNVASGILILCGDGGVGKTAIIKKWFENGGSNIPFYIFKASEFEMGDIDDLFPKSNLNEFIKFHSNSKDKVVVIDSAEKLLYLENTEPFKEFLREFIDNDWRIIFTTRNDYLEVLNTDFSEIYGILPQNIKVPLLSKEELDEMSIEHGFSLPNDERLINLIRNPFYLSKYLKFYLEGEGLSYRRFKEYLWDRIILKSKPAREQVFYQLVKERVNQGKFFISPVCDHKILDDELKVDGIIGYESPHGYYITHDVYEEWAIEKTIEAEFLSAKDIHQFFENLGQSLPVRRSFRNWVSEKLQLENDEINDFIEDSIKGDNVASFWKDEIIIAVLLSDYSDYFFDVCETELLSDSQKLLRRVTFLARLACKEVNASLFQGVGIKHVNLFDLKYVFTKPRGRGWQSLIKFVFDNLDRIGLENIYFVLPVVNDWNCNEKRGETVKYASLIALKFYEWTNSGERFYTRDDYKHNMLCTIVNGASEIKGELEILFSRAKDNKWRRPSEPYYDLSKHILTKIEGIDVARVLPRTVLNLADLFWYDPPNKNRYYSYAGVGVEKYFNIRESILDYFPASAYQTPTYWLLESSLQESIDFIISFTNKTVEAYAKSELDQGQVEEVDVVFDDSVVKQYISNRLWCMYRGTQVSPHIIESMHMALERFFLERGKASSPEALESWLIYLLKKSKSSSISAVVTSIVLAFPDKLFSVAKVLFRTKEFFLYETNRLILDKTHKNSLSLFRGYNYQNEIYENERLKACDDEHRKWSLENICLNYQMFRNEGVEEQEAEHRQKSIWEILDYYYDQLPRQSDQTEAIKTWRLYLARMDRRKMTPTTEEVEGGIAINFNPEIDRELEEYSEKSIQESSEPMKYTSLRLWADHKLKNNEDYKNYPQYEDNPEQALEEAKEIVLKLGSVNGEGIGAENSFDIDTFILMNASIPAFVCSTMIKHHFNKLNSHDQAYCKDIILQVASSTLMPGYEYQINDSSQAVFSTFPLLIDNFPSEKETIKLLLLLTMFNDYPIDMGSTGFNAFAVNSIHELWDSHFEIAQSILLAYLLLKPKYDEFQDRLRKESLRQQSFSRSNDKKIDIFLESHETEIAQFKHGIITFSNISDIQKMDLRILKTAFSLIPLKTENELHKEIVRNIIPPFAESLLSRDRGDRVDYEISHNFLRKYAYFILSANKDEVETYLKPFIDGFNGAECIADMFVEIISAEDQLNAYDNFWNVWLFFKPIVIRESANGDRYWYIDKILRSYLFAENQWKKTATEWHTLQDRDKKFFKDMSKETGHCPSTLYSISKVLNEIGSSYLNDGVHWISYMIKNNKLADAELVSNTVYYLENICRRYIYNNREKVKRSRALKEEIIVILDFLTNEGSVVGYMLRESTL